MTKASIALIWAQGNNRAIGQLGAMPWQVPEDLAYFKKITGNYPVVMGRKTWDSLPERFRPLPGRENRVITRDLTWTAAGAVRYSSLSPALDVAALQVFVIGGGQIYAEAIAVASEIYLTELDVDVPDADTFAPAFNSRNEWELKSETDWLTSTSGISYRFQVYCRKSSEG